GCNWTRELRSNTCWRKVRSHTSTLLRSPVSVSCWIKTGWSKLSTYVCREGNRAADYLASHSHRLLSGIHSIHVSDPTLSMHILCDLFGFSGHRELKINIDASGFYQIKLNTKKLGIIIDIRQHLITNIA
ncbi:hypothetical protein LINGRAHAP2_LOCUS6264, partial [Linum grandiflorum]